MVVLLLEVEWSYWRWNGDMVVLLLEVEWSYWRWNGDIYQTYHSYFTSKNEGCPLV